MTQHLELITGVLVLPLRQTVLVAKQAAELDAFSHGRFTLGVGSGWSYPEYEAMGQEFRTRGKRIEEQVDFLRRLWSEKELTFEGRFDRIDRANLVPLATRRIPILMGGFAEPAYQRAARIADGFLLAFAAHPASAIATWERLQDLLLVEGRNPADFLAHFLVFDGATGGATLEQSLAALSPLRDAGTNAITVTSLANGLTDVQQHIELLARLKDRAADVLA